MALAFVFPGQGSQAVGMGRDLADAFPAARHVFQEVDDALGQKLSKLMWEGPQEELTLTANAQPALMAHSLAVVRALQVEGGFGLAARVTLVAGHSLGEYSALTAAGAFDIATAAKLLRLRGEAMQKATPPGTGAMAALLGAEIELAQEIYEIVGANKELVHPISSETLSFVAERPKFSLLSKEKWISAGLSEVPRWKDSLQLMTTEIISELQ